MNTYKVKKGDSWWRIAKNNNMSMKELMELNNANEKTVIHPGQEVKLKEKVQIIPQGIDNVIGVQDNTRVQKSINSPITKQNWVEQAQAYRKENPTTIQSTPEQPYQTNYWAFTGNTPVEEFSYQVMQNAKKGMQDAEKVVKSEKVKHTLYKGDPARTKQEGDKKDQIANLQRQLKQLGYYTKTVDGIEGNGTRNALAAAEKDGYILEGNKLIKTVSKPQSKAIYLHYPNFIGKASNALKIGNYDIGKTLSNVFGLSDSLPVGHGETLLVNENGKVKYIRYGRYKQGTGVVRPSIKGGNWGIYDYPDMKPGESTEQYINRLLMLNKNGENYLEDAKYGAFEAIEIPNLDYQKALDYANQQANDSNRPEYNIANTCATGACNTVMAGLPNSTKLKILIPTFSSSKADETKNSTIWGMLPGTTNKYAQDMRDLGTSYIFNKK